MMFDASILCRLNLYAAIHCDLILILYKYIQFYCTVNIVGLHNTLAMWSKQTCNTLQSAFGLFLHMNMRQNMLWCDIVSIDVE